jgi:hypothetical protein
MNIAEIKNSVFVPDVNLARKNIERVSKIFDFEYMSKLDNKRSKSKNEEYNDDYLMRRRKLSEK